MISIDVIWKLYLATRLHYLYGYDALKYKGKFNHMEKSMTRPDKILLRGVLSDLPTKRQVVEFCCSNFLYENDNFLYGNEEDSSQFYAAWCGFWKNPSYYITADLSSIETHAWRLGKPLGSVLKDGSIYPLLLENKLRRESLCVLLTWFPDMNLTGFGADKVLDRLRKTSPFKNNSIEKINKQDCIGNFDFEGIQ